MAVAKEQIRQIISENNINSVADIYTLLKRLLPKNKKIPSRTVVRLGIIWSEWRESNSRPLEPHSSALPNCATPGQPGCLESA